MTTLLIPLAVDPANQGQVLEMLRDNISTVIHVFASFGIGVEQQALQGRGSYP
jgi:hypothetical protein